MNSRHLILDSEVIGSDVLVRVACTDGLLPFDREAHTYLRSMTDCDHCMAVHDAWVVVSLADLETHGR